MITGKSGTKRVLATAFAIPVLVVLAGAGTPALAAADVVSLRAEVQNGTLLNTHGVRSMCASGSCQAEVVTTAPGSDTVLSTTTPVGLGATDLERAYHLPAASVGAKGTIGIITAGAYPGLEQDLATYRHQYGLPACTTANGCLKITDFRGGPPVKPDPSDENRESEEDWAGEASLDVDMASAACPGCRITVVQTPDIDATGEPSPDEKGADYAIAYTTAVKLGANAVSLSDMFGSSAALDGATGKKFDHPGVPLFASIGDVPSPPSPQSPPSSKAEVAATDEQAGWHQDLPWVVSVGGTLLKPVDAARTKFTEEAWATLTGSCADVLPPAAGQPASIAKNCPGHRAGADISAIADPSSGPAVYDTYAPFTGKPKNWVVSGGTSASAPFVTGWYVRGEHTANAHGPSALYSAPASTFTDITTGTGAPGVCTDLHWAPALCQAGPGWDGPTGLGTPHGLGWF